MGYARSRYTTKVEPKGRTFTHLCEDTNHGPYRPFVSSAHIEHTVTPYNGFDYVFSYGDSTVVQRYFDASAPTTSWAAISYSPPEVPLAQSRAKMFANLHPSVEETDLGVFLSQAKEAIGMIRRPLGFLQMLNRIPRRGLKGTETLREVWDNGKFVWQRMSPAKRRAHLGVHGAAMAGAAWLELKYGWEPLVDDLTSLGVQARAMYEGYDAAKATTAGFRTFSSTSAKNSQSSVVRSFDSWIGAEPRFGAVKSISSSETVKTELRAQIKSPIMDYDPYEKLRKGLRVIAEVSSIAWELTPYSFVLDWFLPVGSFLSQVGRESPFSIIPQNDSIAPLIVRRTKTETVDTYVGLSRGGSGRTSILKGSPKVTSSEVMLRYQALQSITTTDVPPSTGMGLIRAGNLSALLAVGTLAELDWKPRT